MIYRKFGKLDWKISEIGLGTYAMGGRWGGANDLESLGCLEAAFDFGINFFDTADIYGEGRSELLISKVFSGIKREKIFIATKGGYDFISEPGQVRKNFDISFLEEALHSSLLRMKTDYVDVYQLHGPSIGVIKSGEVFKFLSKMKKLGKIRACGISVYSKEEAFQALEFDDVDVIQYPYNLLNKNAIEEVSRLCLKMNVAIVAREPLGQGLLTGKYSISTSLAPDDFRSNEWTKEFLEKNFRKVKYFRELLVTPKRSLLHAAIRFVIANKNIACVIPGARNVHQLREIVDFYNSPSFTIDEINKLYSDDIFI